MSFKSDKLTVSSILVMNPYLRRVLHDTVSCEQLSLSVRRRKRSLVIQTSLNYDTQPYVPYTALNE